ncbi:hypothetical protein [Nocardioides lijunqiniae]|uniref:hypothetical protein n=1 Tax=Nocardioides lijunqiniae TaxID=2760832 RepID=UPI0018787232|nr:hypothetical protein [Nocardioides lijunqiniae]
MSDERELTAAEEERVRRLLSEARADAPMPDDVAARLDRVIAQLGESEPAPDAHVVALASRRRRKVTTLLVAAAAVVVLGVGIGQVVPQAQQDDASTASDAGGSAAEEAAPPEAAAPDSSAERDAEPFDLVDGVPRVRAERFAADVARVAGLPTAEDPDRSERPQALQSQADSSAPALCDTAAWGEGRLQLVRYDDKPAVLAFRPPMGATQVVDLLQCGTGDVLRSVTLTVD